MPGRCGGRRWPPLGVWPMERLHPCGMSKLRTVLILFSLGSVLTACSEDADTQPVASSPTTIPGTTTTAPLDQRLLTLEDLGSGYELVSDGGEPDGCDVVVPSARSLVGASYVSNDAQQRLAQQLLTYDDEASASAALASAVEQSSCEGVGNLDDGQPQTASVNGADAAFSFGFADENGSAGVVLARSGSAIFVISSKLHNGDVKDEPVGTLQAAELAIARLRPSQ